MTDSEFFGQTVVIVSVSLPIATPWSPTTSGPSLHIGAACMRAFSSYGAKVIGIDSNDEALSQLKREVADSGKHVEFVRSDCCTFRDLSAIASQQAAVNVLVNCHSYPQAVSIESASPREIEDAVRFDLLGPLMASKAFLPNLERAGEAAIVNVGSIDGVLGNPSIPIYSMSKGGARCTDPCDGR